VRLRSAIFEGRYRLYDGKRLRPPRPPHQNGDLIELNAHASHVYRAKALQKVVLDVPPELAPGQTAQVKLTLRAIDAPLPPSTATLDVPEGWSVEPSRQELGPVNPNRDRTVTFDVTPASFGDVVVTGRVTGHDWRAAARAITTVFVETTLQESRSNVGITDDADTAPGDFDGGGASISAQALAQVGATPGAVIEHDGLRFTWPDVEVGAPDNAVASGQALRLAGSGARLGFLVTSTWGQTSGIGTIRYADGTRQTFQLGSPDWYGPPRPGGEPVLVAPYQNRPGNQRHNQPATIYFVDVPLDDKEVRSVQLPNISPEAAPNTPTLHVFAMTIGG
jgi:alpha-L-fucosidase 2